MPQFSSAREAKEFLVHEIVDEAQRENVPLSEIERKMLYFTESSWTLPEMIQVAEEFDEKYDQREYERKIVPLVRHAFTRARKRDKSDKQWLDAIRLLRKEDHYLSALVSQADLRPSHDGWKLWGTGVAVVGLLTIFFLVAAKFGLHPGNFTRYDEAFYLWVAVSAVVIFCALGRAILGRRFYAIVLGLLERVDRTRNGAEK